MFAGLPQAMKLRDEAAEAPVVEVTEAEFVAAMMATGVSEPDARLQLTWARALGADVLCGGRLLRVVVAEAK